MQALEISLRQFSFSLLALVCSLIITSCTKENVQPTLGNGNGELDYPREASVQIFTQDVINENAVRPNRSATEYSSINFQRLHRGDRFHPRIFNPKVDRSIRFTMNRIDSPM